MFNYTIGGLIGAPLAGLAASYFLDWRFAFYMPAIVLLGVLALFYFIQKNKPEDVGLPTIEEYHQESVTIVQDDEPGEGSWQMTLNIIKDPMVILLGAMYFFLKPTRYAILFWGPLFVSETLGTGMAESAFINGAFFLILLYFFNSLVSGGSSLVSAGVLFLIGFLIYGPDSLVSATAAVDFGTRKGASTSSGLINGMGSIGAIVGGTIPGFFKDSWGWDGVFTLMAGSALIAGLLMITKWNALPKNHGVKTHNQ